MNALHWLLALLVLGFARPAKKRPAQPSKPSPALPQKKKPATKKKRRAPLKKEAAPSIPAPSHIPRETRPVRVAIVPFSYEGVKGSNVKALREYDAYLSGELPRESYPVAWEEGEDYTVLKMSPGRWVVIDQEPKELSEVLLDAVIPSGSTIKWLAGGLAISLAPKALAALGIFSPVGLDGFEFVLLQHQCQKLDGRFFVVNYHYLKHLTPPIKLEFLV